jgi:GNAT superfamily N-acetyltransferase
VRAARPSDAGAPGRVQARAWAASYGDLLPAAPDEARLTEAWTTAITDPPSPRHRILVATAGDRVVGFAALAPSTDADAASAGDGPDAELLVLVVDPDDLGRGHGSRLLNASADVLADSGVARLRAWVPEPDTDRLRFLTSAGFATDGATRVLDASGDGSTTVREVRLTAVLPPRNGRR